MEENFDISKTENPKTSSLKKSLKRFAGIIKPTLDELTTEVRSKEIRKRRISEIVNSILEHGLIGAEKSNKMGVERFRGADYDSLGKDAGDVAVILTEVMNQDQFLRSKLQKFPWIKKDELRDDYINSYLPEVARDIINGEHQRSPVTILGERKYTDLFKEIEEYGKKEIEERLKSGILILMSTDKSLSQLRADPEVAIIGGAGLAHTFPQLSSALIEAIFVPKKLFNNVKSNAPRKFKAKIIEVEEYTSPQDYRIYDSNISGYGFEIPDWYPAVFKYLSRAKLNKTLISHAVRLPTLAEINSLQ